MALLRCFLGAVAAPFPRITTDDLIRVVQDDQVFWKIAIPQTYSLRHRADITAGFILAAGNSHAVWKFGGGSNIPGTLPEAALLEVARAMPSILLFRHPFITFEDRLFATQQEALGLVDDVQKVNYHHSWISD